VVLRVAAMLLPYQRPTYRSIEVRTDDDIMQHAGREMRKARALMEHPAEGTSPAAVRDDYLQWANVVLRVAAMLLPYQRPTYRSIEVRTDKGLEERATRFIGDPAERLAQIVVGAIIAQPEDGRRRDAAVGARRQRRRRDRQSLSLGAASSSSQFSH
jgi:hypothetical protein